MAKKKSLEISDLFKLHVIKSVRWSPTGMHAVVVVGSSNVDEQRMETSLWLFHHEDGSFHQITYGPADGEPKWLDEETILFTASKRQPNEEEEDKPFSKVRFYTMSVRGGEPKLAGTVEGIVYDWDLNPARNRMVLSFAPHPDAKKATVEVWKKIQRPIVAHNLRYKMDGTGYLPSAYPSIYVMNLRKKSWSKPKVVIDRPGLWDSQPRWLTNDKIIFHRWHADHKDTLTALFVTDLKGNYHQLPTYAGDIGGYDISPNGKWLVFSGNPDSRKSSFLPSNLYVRSTNPKDKDWRCITDTPGKMGEQITMSDIIEMSFGSGPLRWLDDDTIVTLHSHSGRTDLVKVDAEDGAMTTLVGESGVVHCFDVKNDHILYARGGHELIDELFLLVNEKPVSALNEDVRDKFDIGPERWEVETEDDVKVDTFLWITPEQRKATRKSLPLVFYVHGGPQLQTGGPYFEYTWLAHQGYPVVTANPRGSTGYGAAHGKAIFGNWGDRDVFDLLAVFNDVLERYPQFDPERVFCVGGSYGGYMTNMMLTRHPGLFRAGVTQRSICNFMSFSGTSDFSNFFPGTALGLDHIWEDPERAWERSPISKVQDVSDPLLIIHSDQDHRCPLSQAEELFVALVEMGKIINEDVRMVVFRGESHGLSRAGKPENREVRLQEVLNWIQKHDKDMTVKRGRKRKK